MKDAYLESLTPKWVSVDDRLPVYSPRDYPKEEYDSLAQNNRNSYLCVIELNKKRAVDSGLYQKVLGFDHTGSFYGYDRTGINTVVWRERVIAWMPLPKLPAEVK